jgi:hypothetical protein
MKTLLFALALLLAIAAEAQAWSAVYSWAPSAGATSYRLEKSTDNGASWALVSATATSPFTYTGTEAALTLFRLHACNATACTPRPADGFWHDESRQVPAAPASLGVQ